MASAFSPRSSRSSRRRPRARLKHRSMKSAAPRSAPISPACAMRPNTRAYSGADNQMKITAITTTLINIPYQAGAPTKLAGQSWSRMAILLVRVDTEEGLTGWGEGFGHAIAPATKATLDTMVAAHFIGRDVSDVEALMGEMFQRLHLFGRNGSVVYALSAIGIPLLDI